MEVAINDKAKEAYKAVSFAKQWLESREFAPIEHDDDWNHFVQILSECCIDYHKFRKDDEQTETRP